MLASSRLESRMNPPALAGSSIKIRVTCFPRFWLALGGSSSGMATLSAHPLTQSPENALLGTNSRMTGRLRISGTPKNYEFKAFLASYLEVDLSGLGENYREICSQGQAESWLVYQLLNTRAQTEHLNHAGSQPWYFYP